MSEGRRAQLSSLQATLAAAQECLSKVTTSLDLQSRPWQVCEMVACPVDSEHRVKEGNLPRHASACRWRKLGYLADDMPLPGERGDLGVVITNEDACCIIQKELSKNPSLKTGSCVQFSATRVVCRPAAVGGLVEGCEPETWQRITVDFTPDERRAVYDHVVAVTAPQRIPPPPELAFSGPYPVSRHNTKDDKLGESMAAKMAAERDARRRRVSQKKVSTNRKSHLEVLREVIGNQMQLYCEWLGDELGLADTTATLDWSDQHCDPSIMASGSSRLSGPSIDAVDQRPVDHRPEDQIQNREHDRFSVKGMDDRGRKWRGGMEGEWRGGVRFREGNVGNGDRDRDWDDRERYRERDSTRDGNSRHRNRERDLRVNQGHRESLGGSRDMDGHRERDRIWEDKDRLRVRSGNVGDMGRYKERVGGSGDKDRVRDKERDVESRGSGAQYMRKKDDARFHEEKDRSDDRNRAYFRHAAEKDVSRDRYSVREWEERKESMEYRGSIEHTRSEKTACVVVKTERDSEREATDRDSRFDTVGQIKIEQDADYEVGREKRKRDKEYNWSEDSEKDTKKNNKKKKKKKYKKHKKKRARSSLESESS